MIKMSPDSNKQKNCETALYSRIGMYINQVCVYSHIKLQYSVITLVAALLNRHAVSDKVFMAIPNLVFFLLLFTD